MIKEVRQYGTIVAVKSVYSSMEESRNRMLLTIKRQTVWRNGMLVQICEENLSKTTLIVKIQPQTDKVISRMAETRLGGKSRGRT